MFLCQPESLWITFLTVEVRGFAPRGFSLMRREPALYHPHRIHIVAGNAIIDNTDPSNSWLIVPSSSLEARSSIPASTVFTFSFLDPGTTNIRHTVSYTTDSSGRIVIASLPIPAGTYDIRIASQYYLSKKMTNTSLASNALISLISLPTGDLNADTTINPHTYA